METVGKLACNKVSRKRSYLTILNMFGGNQENVFQIHKYREKYERTKK